MYFFRDWGISVQSYNIGDSIISRCHVHVWKHRLLLQRWNTVRIAEARNLCSKLECVCRGGTPCVLRTHSISLPNLKLQGLVPVWQNRQMWPKCYGECTFFRDWEFLFTIKKVKDPYLCVCGMAQIGRHNQNVMETVHIFAETVITLVHRQPCIKTSVSGYIFFKAGLLRHSNHAEKG